MMTANEARNARFNQIEKLVSDDISLVEKALEEVIGRGENIVIIRRDKIKNCDLLSRYLTRLGYGTVYSPDGTFKVRF